MYSTVYASHSDHRVHGPEVLTVSDVPEPVAGAGQVLITVDRAGINYADTHQVENSYLSKTDADPGR